MVPDSMKHIIFIMVDHYEPGKGERGAEFNYDWLKKFIKIANRHKDSYGNKFRYTWFYPYDHRNEIVLLQLSEMALNEYGEVELHWHRQSNIANKFPHMLKEAIRWFQAYGALISSTQPYRTHFAFIAGNWDLDNCRGVTGINNDLEIMFRSGCYADFTFSTIGTTCQPKKINSIYYVTDDTEKPKSYEDGIDAKAGEPINDRLLIFQGPIAITWKTAGLEYGAVENYALPTKERINRWINSNIHVKGRPEWVFIKIYSHGCQSAKAILDDELTKMLGNLEAICKKRKIKLHYMTAREAFNVVKSAEDSMRGNPENYRDYRIPKPFNAVYPVVSGQTKLKTR